MLKIAADKTVSTTAPAPRRFLRIGQVVELTGMPASTIYMLMARGKFPRSIQLSGRIKAFLEEEVLAWMEKRIEERDTGR